MQSFFNPKFIQRIDQYLLMRFPLVWNSKIHYVIYYTFILICLHIPWVILNNGSDISTDDVAVFLVFASLVVTGFTILWLVFYLRHNSMMQFGARTSGRTWVSMVCNYLVLLMISSTLFIYPGLMFLKFKKTIDYKGIIEKSNQLRLGIVFFPMDAIDEIEGSANQGQDSSERIRLYPGDVGNYQLNDFERIDSSFLNIYEISDAVRKVKTKEQLRLAVNDFLKASAYFGFQHPYSSEKICSFFDDSLYYHRNFEFETINRGLYFDTYGLYGNTFKFEQELLVYLLPVLRFSFMAEPDFYFYWLLVVLPIALLLITVYRHVSTRSFLISSGVTIILVILNLLFLFVILNPQDGENLEQVTATLFIAWTIALLILSFRIFTLEKFKKTNAYALFLLNLLLPYLPFILAALYSETNNDLTHRQEEEYLQTIYVIGLSIWLILQQWLFTPLYERLHALPE
jgi:hypothetical protein